MILAEILIVAVGAYVTVSIIYNIFLLVVHFSAKDEENIVTPCKSIGIVIPAHNEELLLPRLLKSIAHLTYPRELFRTIVIADHCSDDTSKVARESGALALERSGSTSLGKGHALKWALHRTDIREFDALLVVDADSVLSSDALTELCGFLDRGEEIMSVLQRGS